MPSRPRKSGPEKIHIARAVLHSTREKDAPPKPAARASLNIGSVYTSHLVNAATWSTLSLASESSVTSSADDSVYDPDLDNETMALERLFAEEPWEKI